MSSTARRLIVSGATGKQGGSLISALLSNNSQPFEIYALTRNKNSPSAKALAVKPNVHVIEGNWDKPSELFQQVSKPWGLFSVTTPMSAAKEEQQGKAMTAAALEAGIQHIVFTATDRGPRSDEDPTDVAHFASKFNIEKDIISKAEQTGATWTFLRPVAFYENLTPDFLGKAFVSMWRLNGPESKIKMVSTKDIGKVAAQAFLEADSDAFRNKAIALAGDDVSLVEAEAIFREVTGEQLPETFSIIGRLLRFGLKEQLGSMFDWFKHTGFGVDPAVVKKDFSYMKDFRAWLETESAWRK